MGMDDDHLHLRLAVRKASSLDDVRLMEADSRRKRWRGGADMQGGKAVHANGAVDQILEQKRALGRHGSSLLHIAAYFGRVSVVEELLKKGFSMDDKNSLRWSSHHYLCRFHQPLNKKLSLGLRPKPAKSQSRGFKFTYYRPPTNAVSAVDT